MGKGWDGVTLNFRRDTLGHGVRVAERFSIANA